jgi:excisionase family DNA binding protein
MRYEPRWTMSVTEAGKYLGLSRNSAYAAAARGEIPTIRVGKLLRVPVPAFERMLGIEQPATEKIT